MNNNPIKVVDSIMGSGKTSAAINLMNNDTENNYIFITPYLNEIDRIKSQCTNRKFYDPKVFSKHGETFYKIDSLHKLLEDNKNIATTHALFKMSTKETKDLIYAGNYILILDEVMEVIKQLEVSTADVQMLLNEKWIIDNEGVIVWNTDKEKELGEEYKGEFSTVKRLALNKNLILHKGKILFWNFPADIFKLFKDVYVLTYMFDAQLQKYYYDMNNITYDNYISVKENDTYSFKQKENYTDKGIKQELKSKINIYDGSLNNIGDDHFALSKSWYDNKKHLHKKMKNNITNYFINIMGSKSNFNMWTTFKDYQSKLSGKGYTKGFVSCTARATNEYSHKNTLVYSINRFTNPIIKEYFYSYNISINDDLFALSELIQWIWRGDIRNGNEINLYIPSKRMRNLLIDWLDDKQK
jgi:hypothetical protein